MSDGEKPSGMGAGKIVLIVVAVLVVLGAICCAGLWLKGGKFIKGGVQLTVGTGEMQAALLKEVGEGTTVQFLPDDDGAMILAIGVTGEITDDRAREVQDTAWKAYCKAFEKGGFKVTQVGVGQPGGMNQVRGVRSHMVPVEEVAQRTSTPAPPMSEMFQEIERLQREAEEQKQKKDTDQGQGGGAEDETK